MSFDARSRERLEALGRQLPRRLPEPEPAAVPQPQQTARRLHPVEREEDPANLFRALIDASADGSVPPHLMERLRHLETPTRHESAAPSDASAAVAPPTPAPGRRRTPRAASEQRENGDQALYIAFRQLLDEDDD